MGIETLSHKIWPTGDVVSGSQSTVVQGSPWQAQALPPFPHNGQPYSFMFWDAIGVITTNASVQGNAPGDGSDFLVEAWYGSGGVSHFVTTWAFSSSQGIVIPNVTPIQSVNVSGAWPGPPSTSVDTTKSTASVNITALPLIHGYGKFSSWLIFGNGSANGNILTVPANGGAGAIAVYSIPIPDPCDDIRSQLENLSPGDFRTDAEYQKAFRYLEQQLHACELKYAEI
jgi:hypothetical protein